MEANEVIDSYVYDVARRLPPSRRNDVAFELRTLLTDDLESQAAEQGRPPDHDMAVEMLRKLGRPSETAVRYYRPFTVIEPSDTWSFATAVVVGWLIISLLSPSGNAANVAALAWIGLLVTGFGIRSLILRRRPDALAWKPRPVRDPDAVSRSRSLALALGSLALLVVYLAPGWAVETVAGPWVTPGNLHYTDNFASPWRMPWLAGALVVFAGLQLIIASRDHWQPGLRWARLAVSGVIGTQLGWHSRYGDIFIDPEIDDLAIVVMGLSSAAIVVACGVAVYREYTRIRPAPAATATF